MITVIKEHEFAYLRRMANLNRLAVEAGFDSHEHAAEAHRAAEKKRRRKALAALKARRQGIEITPFIG